MVSAWHLVLWTSSLYPQRYIVVSLSSDKCPYCECLWIIASAKCPESKWGYRHPYCTAIDWRTLSVTVCLQSTHTEGFDNMCGRVFNTHHMLWSSPSILLAFVWVDIIPCNMRAGHVTLCNELHIAGLAIHTGKRWTLTTITSSPSWHSFFHLEPAKQI